MPKVLDNIITGAAPDPATHTVTLTWASGKKTVNSFGHLVGKGAFALFADPAFFAQVRVGEGGRSLEWPDELDFCADYSSRPIPSMRSRSLNGRDERIASVVAALGLIATFCSTTILRSRSPKRPLSAAPP